jgi:hypothetical protein
MNKIILVLSSVLLSASLLAGCSANGINTKSTGNNHANNNGSFRPLETRFTDVSPIEWYSDAVQWGSNLGIINGYPDHTFRPNSTITRAEVIKIIKTLADNGYLNVPSPTPTSPTPTVGVSATP